MSRSERRQAFKLCKQCRQPFSPNKWVSKFCSQACRLAYSKGHFNKPPASNTGVMTARLLPQVSRRG